jgi:hypothetical protein
VFGVVARPVAHQGGYEHWRLSATWVAREARVDLLEIEESECFQPADRLPEGVATKDAREVEQRSGPARAPNAVIVDDIVGMEMAHAVDGDTGVSAAVAGRDRDVHGRTAHRPDALQVRGAMVAQGGMLVDRRNRGSIATAFGGSARAEQVNTAVARVKAPRRHSPCDAGLAASERSELGGRHHLVAMHREVGDPAIQGGWGDFVPAIGPFSTHPSTVARSDAPI